jgi:mannose-1-phosphate guanylyltransferase
VDEFLKIVGQGYALVEKHPNTLVTFGIAPTSAATGYGYLELGESIDPTARVVKQFKEKPDLATATDYFKAGASRYLWNSGMFVWKASTLLDCVRRFAPENFVGIQKVADAWGTANQQKALAEVYPTLKKISVDFAIMEPASRDSVVKVAAVPMPLGWLDVGSWPMFGETVAKDTDGNALSAEKTLAFKSKNNLVVSNDKNHAIALVGCEDLIVIHTPDVTMVCKASEAESVKEAHKLAGAKFGAGVL